MAAVASLRAFTARPCTQRPGRRAVQVQAAETVKSAAPAAVKVRGSGAHTQQGTVRWVCGLGQPPMCT
jgi:hypothetical protein